MVLSLQRLSRMSPARRILRATFTPPLAPYNCPTLLPLVVAVSVVDVDSQALD